jgi:hypothetical protein
MFPLDGQTIDGRPPRFDRVEGAMSEDNSAHLTAEAALGLVESLLLHLVESKKLSQDEFGEIFTSLMDAHREAAEETDDPRHKAIITLLEKVQSGHNGVRLTGSK